jgi:hypothetical protein
MQALLEAKAATTVQALASNAQAPHRPGQARPVRIWRLDALLNSCWSYRSDGPAMQRLRRR